MLAVIGRGRAVAVIAVVKMAGGRVQKAYLLACHILMRVPDFGNVNGSVNAREEQG
jgi:hypothetical protein